MTTCISCVIDHDPRFLTQARLLLASLRSAGISESDQDTVLVVHVPEGMIGDSALDPLLELGATLQPFRPFASGLGAYCNKLVQFETGLLQQAERVLLVDADVLFLRDPRPIFHDEAIRAKIVDSPNPPERKWRALFEAAGFPQPALALVDLGQGELTPSYNCNGGAYYLPRAAFTALTEAWPRWARFCLAQEELLGKQLRHSDQLGFALAMEELRLPFRPLSIAENFPTQFPAKAYATVAPAQITALHYHDHVDDQGVPAPIGIDWVDRQILEGVKRIRQNHRIGLDNAAFWEARYATDPALGSGYGSRGEVMLDKRRQLEPVLESFATRPVVDIGCGDLEVLRVFNLADYHGYDLSPTGLELARGKRPDWRFTQGAGKDVVPLSADLSICLDVAIHQPDAASYHQLVNSVVAASRDTVLISGYEKAPGGRGIVFFHEPLSQTLGTHPDIAHVTRIGGWRDVTLFMAQRHRQDIPVQEVRTANLTAAPATSAVPTPQESPVNRTQNTSAPAAAVTNPHDIAPAQLAREIAASPHPELLAELAAIGREQLGFFPQTIIRCTEYPWIAARMPRTGGLRVLDMGAGVAPLPLWLARQGAQVTTVDGHDLVRTPPAARDWNEWGFLDYGKLDGRIRSYNCLMQELEGAGPFDVVYSVSVIEHIPAEARRAVLAAMHDVLVPGGRLLLTLDLIPGTDRLWDRAEGKRVDQPDTHGTIADFLGELADAGFTLTEQVLFRAIAGSRTELLMADAYR